MFLREGSLLRSWRLRPVGFIALNILLFFSCPSALYAQVTDPFEGVGNWVSIDDFINKAQNPEPEDSPKEEKKDKEGPPVLDRPLNPPSMPGATAQPSSGETLMMPALPDFMAAEKRWMTLDEAHAEYIKQKMAIELITQEDGGFKIRFATLPHEDVTATPAQRITKSKLDREARSEKALAPKKPELPPEKMAEQNKACEALTEMRKKQLQALESDRQTLAQLKQAMAELGVAKKLSFMTDGQTSMTIAPTDATGDATSDQASP